MPVYLRDDVFMARADGFLLFLDLDRDRYCAMTREVSGRLGPGIAARGQGIDPDLVECLRKANVLTERLGRDFALTEATRPTREVAACAAGAPSAFKAVFWRRAASLELRRRPIGEIVAARRARRYKTDPRVRDEVIRRLAGQFAATRPLAGARDACLREALALLGLLGSAGCGADWVFAVRGAPFAAHCWIQHGDIVLNDTLDNVSAYTPIMVV